MIRIIALAILSLVTAVSCTHSNNPASRPATSLKSPPISDNQNPPAQTSPLPSPVTVAPIPLENGFEADDLPLPGSLRSELWTRLSVLGRIYLNSPASGEPKSWAGAMYAVCGRPENLVFDFTKVSFVPFKAGPVQILDASGNLIGTAKLSRFDKSTTENGNPSHILTFTDVQLPQAPSTFTLSRLNAMDGSGVYRYANPEVRVANCNFLGNRTYDDIKGKKTIQVPILPRKDTNETEILWTDYYGSDFSYGFLLGFLHNQTVGTCKFSYNADLTGIMDIKSITNDGDICELSSGVTIRNGMDLIVDIYRDGVHIFHNVHNE